MCTVFTLPSSTKPDDNFYLHKNIPEKNETHCNKKFPNCPHKHNQRTLKPVVSSLLSLVALTSLTLNQSGYRF